MGSRDDDDTDRALNPVSQRLPIVARRIALSNDDKMILLMYLRPHLRSSATGGLSRDTSSCFG